MPRRPLALPNVNMRKSSATRVSWPASSNTNVIRRIESGAPLTKTNSSEAAVGVNDVITIAVVVVAITVADVVADVADVIADVVGVIVGELATETVFDVLELRVNAVISVVDVVVLVSETTETVLVGKVASFVSVVVLLPSDRVTGKSVVAVRIVGDFVADVVDGKYLSNIDAIRGA